MKIKYDMNLRQSLSYCFLIWGRYKTKKVGLNMFEAFKPLIDIEQSPYTSRYYRLILCIDVDHRVLYCYLCVSEQLHVSIQRCPYQLSWHGLQGLSFVDVNPVRHSGKLKIGYDRCNLSK